MSDLDRLESLMTSLADIVDDDEDQREFERGLARRMPEESADWLMFLSGACTGVAVTATDPYTAAAAFDDAIERVRNTPLGWLRCMREAEERFEALTWRNPRHEP